MEHFYKISFDAAYTSDNISIGIGIVLRDCRGDAEIVLSAPRLHVPFFLFMQNIMPYFEPSSCVMSWGFLM